MTIAALMNQPVAIIRRSTGGTTDEHGNANTNESAPVMTVGYLEQTAATEVEVDRQTYITDWLIFLPPDTQIDGGDRLLHEGHAFEVVGQPAAFWNPRLRATSHLQMRAVEVTG